MTSIAKPDYWALLGLEPGSDSYQLKRAFRREARKWHPDLNGNDRNAEERFKLVNEAYAVLSDPIKKQIWENQLEDNNLSKDSAKSSPEYNKDQKYKYNEALKETDDNKKPTNSCLHCLVQIVQKELGRII